MKALFFIILTPVLIVLQTVIFPSITIFANSFDLMIIGVLYLCLIASHHSIILAVMVMGAVMDSVSGVPFFYYIFSYMFIYIIVHLVKQFLFKQSTVFIIVISLVSVLIEHGLLIFTIFIRQGAQGVASFDFKPFLWQAFWGVILIPPGVWALNEALDIWIKVLSGIKKQFIKKIEG